MMNLTEATVKALEGKLTETPENAYRAVRIVDASEPNILYKIIMLNNNVK